MDSVLTPFSVAFVAGLLCGIIISIPLGPVGLAVINQTLRRGFLSGFKLALGGACGEVIYSSLMLAGHSAFFNYPVFTHVAQFLAIAIMAILGTRYVFFKPEQLRLGEAAAERVDERWHHPRSFLLGFLMTSTNVMLALLWATIGAFLFAHDWVSPEIDSRAGCVIGAAIGSALWFSMLAWFVARAHRRVTPRTLTLLVRVCGIVLLAMTVLLTWRVARGVAHSDKTTPGGAGETGYGGGPRLSTK